MSHILSELLWLLDTIILLNREKNAKF